MESKSDAAISAAIEIMRQNNEFPGLQTALAKLVAASTAAAAAADAAAPAAAVPAAASAPAVPAASAPAVPAASTAAAAAAPAAAAVPAPAAAAPAADAVPAVENDDNSEINDSEVISYNDGKTSSSYRVIIRMLEETLGQDMSEDDKNKIRNLMIAVMHSKKPTEVQTLMNEFGTLDPVGEGPTAYYKITDKKGGTRKHRNKRNKLQRKRVKTMKNKKKKKAGKRK